MRVITKRNLFVENFLGSRQENKYNYILERKQTKIIK